MRFSSLVTLLDSSAVANRPAGLWPVWHVAGSPKSDSLLESLIRTLLEARIPLFLGTDGTVEERDLGPGSWNAVFADQWRVPESLDPVSFLAGRLGGIGNYFIYSRSTPLPSGLPQHLPWWGFAARNSRRRDGSAEALVVGLQQAQVALVIAVHPDASSCIVVIPSGEPIRPSAV